MLLNLVTVQGGVITIEAGGETLTWTCNDETSRRELARVVAAAFAADSGRALDGEALGALLEDAAPDDADAEQWVKRLAERLARLDALNVGGMLAAATEVRVVGFKGFKLYNVYCTLQNMFTCVLGGRSQTGSQTRGRCDSRQCTVIAASAVRGNHARRRGGHAGHCRLNMLVYLIATYAMYKHTRMYNYKLTPCI